MARLAEQQARLLPLLRGQAHGPQWGPGTLAWTPVPGPKDYFACGRGGHLRRVCPYWVGAERPHPGKTRVPPVNLTGGLQTCWTCGEQGHLKRECPHRSPKARASPEERARAQTTRTRAVARGRRRRCFHCHTKGHINRHCPLRQKGEVPETKAQSETSPRKGVVKAEAPKEKGAGAERPHLKQRTHTRAKRAEVGIQTAVGTHIGLGRSTVGTQTIEEETRSLLQALGSLRAERDSLRTQQVAGTQTITPPVLDGETQTEWAQREAGAQEQHARATKGTQVVLGQTTTGSQTLREEGLGVSSLRARLEAAERALRESEASRVEFAKDYAAVVEEEVRLRKLLQESEKKRVALEAHRRVSQAKKPPYPQGWGF